MQGETILLLVLIFIILAAVIVIGVLYFMYTSKYDESNIFYKNLLEVIRENPSLSSDVESKLLKSDFDITDLTSNERSLSNIFGSTIYSENQLDRLNSANKDYTISEINRLDSNIPKDPEKGFYKNTYELINTGDKSLSNLYGLDFNKNDEVYNKLSNLKQIYDVSNYSNIRPYSVMNSVIDTQQGSNMSFQTSLNILNPLSNLTPFYNIDDNKLKITSNLRVNALEICDTNFEKCYTLSVNNGHLVANNPSTVSGLLDNSAFVFGDFDGANRKLYIKGDANTYTPYTIGSEQS
jgi:hypothetical protein